jgi:uncharacterized membrane protein YuzA (DUF378 family)
VRKAMASQRNKNMKALHGLAFVLVIVGGLNWLLVGLTGWDVGQIFGGQDALISKIVYVLVGLSAIFLVGTHKSDCKHCETVTPTTPSGNPM